MLHTFQFIYVMLGLYHTVSGLLQEIIGSIYSATHVRGSRAEQVLMSLSIEA